MPKAKRKNGANQNPVIYDDYGNRHYDLTTMLTGSEQGWGSHHSGYGANDRSASFEPEPPAPTGPSAAELSNDFSTRHWRRDQRHTLRFHTLPHLKMAILAHARELPQALVKAVRDAGSSHEEIASIYKYLNLPASGGSPVEGLLRSIGNLESGRYRGNWDWHGPFRKTSIDVEAHTDGTFSLGIYAAYRGNAAEFDLAERLGVLIGFARTEFDIMWAPQTEAVDRFRIPLSDFQEIAASVAPATAWDAAEFVNRIASIDRDGERAPPSLVLYDDGDIMVSLFSLSWQDITLLQRMREPPRDYEIKSEDGFLTGPAVFDRGFHMPRATKLELSIYPKSGVTYDKALETRIMEIGDQVGMTLERIGMPSKAFQG